MSVIVEFSIPASEFALGRGLQAVPDLTIELEQMVPTGGAAIPYFWVIGSNREEFESVIQDEPALVDYEAVDELEDRTLYRAEWNKELNSFVQLVIDHDAVLQNAGGNHETWTFQLRFRNSHTLSEFHSACRGAGIDLSLERMYNPIEADSVGTHELTEAQHDLIERAYDSGFFEVPREITLVELADELGLSDQAVNERLRRGLNTLIETTVKSRLDREEND